MSTNVWWTLTDGGTVGAWNYGPFDNDTAADWCADLDEADPEERPDMIEGALIAAAEEVDYLDSDLACEAIAAAAIVAAGLPGGQPIDSPYAPDFLIVGGSVEVPAHVPALAVEALDRVAADDSEWRDLWEDSAESMAVVAALRAVLARA